KEFMQEARRLIKPADLGIPGALRVRQVLTGVMLIEMPGSNSGAAADRLAAEKGPDYRVQRPVRTTALRLTGLDLTIGAEEVVAALSQLAGGGFRWWIERLPARDSSDGGPVPTGGPQVAAKVAAAGRVQVGWTRAKVVVLPARVMICFRCLEQGHRRWRCTSAVDRSNCCYHCGNLGHRADQCKA
ncbi:hypothetical protein EAI_05064, partial [Harpegnathos saltator]